MKIKHLIAETTGVTDYNPKSQGGTRKELLAKYHKTKDPKDAEAARKAGATQKELKGDSVNEASTIDGKVQDPKSNRWKQTSLSPKEAIAKYGKENVRIERGALRNGGDMVEVKVTLGEQRITEVDPRNFDSDEDYYNAARKQGRQQFSGDWDVWDETCSGKRMWEMVALTLVSP